jgi:hypothetical protein
LKSSDCRTMLGCLISDVGFIPMPDVTYGLLDALVLYFKKELKREVEIEGSWDEIDDMPTIFQLRTYTIPPDEKIMLSSVADTKKVYSGDTIGAANLEGHIVVAKSDFSESNLTFRQNHVKRPYILYIVDKDFAKEIDYNNYPNCTGVIFDLFTATQNGHFVHSHNTGFAYQLQARARKFKFPTFSIQTNLDTRLGLQNNGVREYTNMIAQSNGKQGQIYKSL